MPQPSVGGRVDHPPDTPPRAGYAPLSSQHPSRATAAAWGCPLRAAPTETTIATLRAQLAEAERLEQESRRERQRRTLEAWAAWPKTYQYRALPNKTDDPSRVAQARVERRLEPKAVESFEAQHGLIPCQDQKGWHGMCYYLTDEGILHYEGGGHVIMRTPKLCSTEEWQSILDGNIPSKFLK